MYWIIGSNGQVGQKLVELFVRNNVRFECAPRGVMANMDMLSLWREKLVSGDVVINLSAYNDVDSAQVLSDNYLLAGNNNLCRTMNIDSVRRLAEYCSPDCKLIHFSTDYVFDVNINYDNRNVTFMERDCPNPKNNYGKSKYFGERVIGENCLDYLIFRTSWIYGSSKKNFVNSIVCNALNNKSFSVCEDEISIPNNAADIADTLYYVLGFIKENKVRSGIYHLTAGGEPVSRYEFAKFIVENVLKDNRVNIIPSRSSYSYRPQFSALDNRLFEKTFDYQFSPWRSYFLDFVNGKS